MKTQAMEIEQIPVESIRPGKNIRHDLTHVSELIDSIRSKGLLQPLIVSQRNGRYQIIAGHRRFHACKLLKWATIPCIVRQTGSDETTVLQMIENIQRRDLTALELAEAVGRIRQETGWPAAKIAESIGMSEAWISVLFRFLDFAEELIGAGMSRKQLNGITAGHMRHTIGLSTESRKEVLTQVLQESLSASQLQKRVRQNYARTPTRSGQHKRARPAFEAPKKENAGQKDSFSIMIQGEFMKLMFPTESSFNRVLGALKELGGVVI